MATMVDTFAQAVRMVARRLPAKGGADLAAQEAWRNGERGPLGGLAACAWALCYSASSLEAEAKDHATTDGPNTGGGGGGAAEAEADEAEADEALALGRRRGRALVHLGAVGRAVRAVAAAVGTQAIASALLPTVEGTFSDAESFSEGGGTVAGTGFRWAPLLHRNALETACALMCVSNGAADSERALRLGGLARAVQLVLGLGLVPGGDDPDAHAAIAAEACSRPVGLEGDETLFGASALVAFGLRLGQALTSDKRPHGLSLNADFGLSLGAAYGGGAASVAAAAAAGAEGMAAWGRAATVVGRSLSLGSLREEGVSSATPSAQAPWTACLESPSSVAVALPWVLHWVRRALAVDPTLALPSASKLSGMACDYPSGKPLQLVHLPASYTDLHCDLVAKLQASFKAGLQGKGSSNDGAGDGDLFGGRSDQKEARPALCLLCGQVLDADGKGKCTRHAASCGLGVGCFILLQECMVLLLHGQRASYRPSPYVDDHGERHGQMRGRPLHQDAGRLRLMRSIVAQHEVSRGGSHGTDGAWFVLVPSHVCASLGVQIPSRVVHSRSTSSKIIIPNYCASGACFDVHIFPFKCPHHSMAKHHFQ
jgi:hypothetical protein